MGGSRTRKGNLGVVIEEKEKKGTRGQNRPMGNTGTGCQVL